MAPDHAAAWPGVLREGDTCWKRAHAGRVAFLVDGERYFTAVADALENAQRSVWLLGWDFHSEVRLRREPGSSRRPVELVALLDELVRERPSLHVWVLGWDYAMLYALEREFLPLLQFGRRTHRRVRFALDDAHPLTASHHQKLVIVDDAVAFTGGFDLTSHRWDTRDHAPNDPRRTTPAGKPYQPFHDVQIAVDDEAAAALAELARTRWRRATGREARAADSPGDPWPETLEVAVRDVAVGIARTQPCWADAPEIREVERLYLASIAAARQSLYIENQYLTASGISDAIAARLSERDGPEVVIVGPRENAGWLEENTMGALRDRAIRQLRAADANGRLRVVHPHVAGLADEEIVNVHSKVMIVDDEFARIGSSNLSNRSLGLDTECDLAFEALGREDVRSAIAALRNDLLGEHLGVGADRVARAGSPVAAVDALAGGDRTLRPIEVEDEDWAADAVETVGAVDPEHPIPLEELVELFVDRERVPRAGGVIPIVVVISTFVALALAWRLTPLASWITPEAMAEALAWLRGGGAGLVLATLGFAVASNLLVPVTALTVGAGIAFGPFLGVAVAWAGTILGAVSGHALGNLLWRDAVRRLAGDRLNALSVRLARRGVLSTILVRIVPVAPFPVVNLVAGASHVRLRDFTLGTAIGTFPGITLLIVATDRLLAAIRDPSGAASVWAVAAVAGLLGAAFYARHWITRTEPRPERGSS